MLEPTKIMKRRVNNTTMKEYKVKICETRYEYVEACSPCQAIKKAKNLVATNADEVRIEVLEEEQSNDDLVRRDENE